MVIILSGSENGNKNFANYVKINAKLCQNLETCCSGCWHYHIFHCFTLYVNFISQLKSKVRKADRHNRLMKQSFRFMFNLMLYLLVWHEASHAFLTRSVQELCVTGERWRGIFFISHINFSQFLCKNATTFICVSQRQLADKWQLYKFLNDDRKLPFHVVHW